MDRIAGKAVQQNQTAKYGLFCPESAAGRNSKAAGTATSRDRTTRHSCRENGIAGTRVSDVLAKEDFPVVFSVKSFGNKRKIELRADCSDPLKETLRA
ncbi:MAG: hypothetical protein ACLTSG_06020 [Lachnospiraceae bacterium]